MAGNPNTLIALGSSPDSYFIGHGRRHFVENMSDSFTEHAKKDLTISMTRWISVNKTMEWVSYNDATGNFHYNSATNQTVRDHISATNGKCAAEYISFPDNEDPAHYFVKGKGEGKSLTLTQTSPGFFSEREKPLSPCSRTDSPRNSMTKRFLRTRRSTPYARSAPHRLHRMNHYDISQVLQQYSEGWCIDRASTLCFYDSRYFFIKFKRPGESQIMMHWNLPPHMNEKLAELQELAQQPEEKITLTQEDQMWLNVFQSRLNNELQMSMMFANQMHRGGLGLLAVATGGTVVETPRY